MLFFKSRRSSSREHGAFQDLARSSSVPAQRGFLLVLNSLSSLEDKIVAETVGLDLERTSLPQVL